MRGQSVFPMLFAVVALWLLSPAVGDNSRDADWVERAARGVLNAYDHDSVLIVGELHGTAETPALASALTRVLARDSRVVLGLEIDRQEQPRIDEFLRSDGSADSVSALLASNFWQAEPARGDGRRSHAIVQLIEAIRVARLSGSAISIVALDDATFFHKGVDRNQALASRIAALYEQEGEDVVIILIGNYHARVTPPPEVISEGEVLVKPPVPTAARIANVPITAVNVTGCSGEFWSCISTDSCGPVKVPGQCSMNQYPVVEELDASRYGYHLSVTFERLTPSPPAMESVQ